MADLPDAFHESGMYDKLLDGERNEDVMHSFGGRKGTTDYDYVGHTTKKTIDIRNPQSLSGVGERLESELVHKRRGGKYWRGRSEL